MNISFDSTLIPLAINKEVVFSLNQIKQHPKQKDRNTTNFAPLVKQFSSSRNVCKIKSAKISSIKQMIIFSQLLTKKYFPVQNKYYGSIYSPVKSMSFWKNFINKENIEMCQVQQPAYIGTWNTLSQEMQPTWGIFEMANMYKMNLLQTFWHSCPRNIPSPLMNSLHKCSCSSKNFIK